jgi:hypothetical protein
MTIDRKRWAGIGTDALIVLLVASIPFGLFMAFYMDNSSWLWFCATLIIFLS